MVKVGRFVEGDGGKESCEWSASSLVVAFHGDILKIEMQSEGDNYLEVELDGKHFRTLHLPQGIATAKITENSKPNHVARFVRRTEAFFGKLTFEKFYPSSSGGIDQAQPNPHLMEAIGDSITCGFGNEGKSKDDPFKAETENVYLAYPSLAGRAVNADVQTYAWSGRKMWPDNTMPSVYDLALPTDPASKWDVRNSRKADVILIHLGTNDFGKDNPEQAGWVAAYEAFLVKLRQDNPSAQVYCAMGSMMSDNWPPNHKALTTLRDYLTTIVDDRHKAGDEKVKLLEFDVQQESDGLGSSWHPNLVTHQKMADRLVSVLHQDLGW